MLDRKEDVYKRLDELNITYEVVSHKAIFTIEEMELLGLKHTDKVLKNLFLRDDKKRTYYLVLLVKDKKIDLRKLKDNLNSRPLSFANEEELYRYLGLKKGAVTPLGLLNDKNGFIKVIIDKDILDYDIIGVHPNENTATVYITLEDLKCIMKINNNEVTYIDI